MKHLLLILIVAIGAYAMWSFAGSDMRKTVTAFVSRHLLRVLAIVLPLLALLALAFHSRSINIL